eukprot:6173694-Prymnesium_polylepis.1
MVEQVADQRHADESQRQQAAKNADKVLDGRRAKPERPHLLLKRANDIVEAHDVHGGEANQVGERAACELEAERTRGLDDARCIGVGGGAAVGHEWRRRPEQRTADQDDDHGRAVDDPAAGERHTKLTRHLIVAGKDGGARVEECSVRRDQRTTVAWEQLGEVEGRHLDARPAEAQQEEAHVQRGVADGGLRHHHQRAAELHDGGTGAAAPRPASVEQQTEGKIARVVADGAEHKDGRERRSLPRAIVAVVAEQPFLFQHLGERRPAEHDAGGQEDVCAGHHEQQHTPRHGLGWRARRRLLERRVGRNVAEVR